MSENSGNILRDNLLSIVGLLSLFITIIAAFWSLSDKIATQGERIAKLEERISICVECGNLPKEKNKSGDIWTEYNSKEKDDKGSTSFGVEIDVLEDKYRWNCGKFTKQDIIKKGWLMNSSETLDEIIKRYEPNKELGDAKKIIVVGTASSEGDLNRQNNLAEQRAKTLFEVVKNNINSNVPIIGMSFGQYVADTSNAKCSDDTSEQRRIFIVKVTQLPDGISDYQLEQEIKERFVELKDKNPSFPVDIRDYSNFRDKKQMFLK
ncbi:MAG TPA: hypothetical protein VF644_12670 [Pyrinomonadaceae bacterium]|jgi:hypothetical protein